MFLRTIILFVFCLLTVQPLLAKPKATHAATPSWVIKRTKKHTQKPNSRDIQYGYYLSFYDEQVNVAKQSKYYHIEREITNETGVQYSSEVSIDFAASYQKLIFHEISIVRNGKKINKLNINEVKVVNTEPQLSDFLIYDFYNAIVILDDVRKGDRLILSYSITGFNPIYNNKYGGFVSLSTNNIISNHFTSIIIPKNRKLQYKTFNNAQKPTITTEGANTIYDWGCLKLKKANNKEYTPKWYREYPYIELSEYNSWAEVAKWATSIIDNKQHYLPKALEKKIDQWSKKADGDKAKFTELALRFVQDDIRYLGMEIGAYSHKPHKPSKTYTNRYGDCKDKSLLLTTILRKKGIEAALVLVNTNRKKQLINSIPSAILFNHAIVRAKVDGTYYYLDPTISYQRGELKENAYLNYGYGLVVKNDTKKLSEINFIPTGWTTINEEINLSYDGTTTISSHTTYTGSIADDMRSSFSYSSIKDLEESYEKYYADLYNGAKKTKDLEIIDDSVNNVITVNEQYDLTDPWEESGDVSKLQVLCRTVYENLVDPSDFADMDNKHPVYLKYPTNLEHNIKVNLPDEWDIESDYTSITGDNYEFISNIFVKDNTVTLSYKLTTTDDYIDSNDVEKYKKDYEEITTSLVYDFSMNRKLNEQITQIKSKGNASNINWISVFIGILAAVGAFMVLLKQNKKMAQTYYEEEGSPSIGGWLILLGIIIAIRIIAYGYAIYTGEYFSTETWLTINAVGNTGLQLFILLELIVAVAFMVYAIWLFYWFVKCRDLFPKMFIIFAVSELVINGLYLLITFIFKEDILSFYPEMLTIALKAFVKSIFFVAIWVSAVANSDKVKRTFVRTHPSQNVE